MQSSVSTLLGKHFPDKVSKGERTAIELSAVRFLLRVDSSAVFKKVIRNTYGAGQVVIDFQRDILNNGYYLKTLKLFLVYAFHAGAAEDKSLARKLAKKFGVETCDVKLCSHLGDKRIAKVLRGYHAAGCEPLTIKQMDKVLTNLNKDTRVFTLKYVKHSLRFATMSSFNTIDDFTRELQLRGMQKVLLHYPNMECYEHALNTAKRIIHNEGQNLITHYARTSSGNLVSTKGGFLSRTISIDAVGHDIDINNTVFLNEGFNPILDVDAFSCSDESRYVEELSIKRLVYRYTGKKRTLISLMLGFHDIKFTRFLKDKHGVTKDNDVFYDKLLKSGNSKTYIKYIAQYLDVPLYKCNRLLRSIGKEMMEVKYA